MEETWQSIHLARGIADLLLSRFPDGTKMPSLQYADPQNGKNSRLLTQ
jgi:hypothetical protein